MARVSTFQNKHTITLARKGFMDEIVLNDTLSKTELRVYLHLLTHLDADDYRAIHKKAIARDLGLTKNEVENAIFTLEDQGIIDFGANGTVKKGYKFTF